MSRDTAIDEVIIHALLGLVDDEEDEETSDSKRRRLNYILTLSFAHLLTSSLSLSLKQF